MSSHQPTPLAPEESIGDRHIVETPEQIQLQFAIAGIGSRFLAVAIDTLIQSVVGSAAGLVVFLLGLTGFLKRWRVTSLWVMAGLIALFFLLYFGYFAAFEIFWSGQTPGKRAIGIRVIKETGRPLSPAETIGRNLLRIIDQMPGFYAVGVLTAMFNAQSKRLGDFVAGSIVIFEKSIDAAHGSWTVSPSPLLSTSLGASRLAVEDISLIDAFLGRRHDLIPDVRRRMAHEVLHRIEPKLTLTEANRADIERTLESIVHEYRSTGRY